MEEVSSFDWRMEFGYMLACGEIRIIGGSDSRIRTINTCCIVDIFLKISLTVWCSDGSFKHIIGPLSELWLVFMNGHPELRLGFLQKLILKHLFPELWLLNWLIVPARSVPLPRLSLTLPSTYYETKVQ